jgi:phosphatidylglycerol:prolipoprotein diacylglycerol transferase
MRQVLFHIPLKADWLPAEVPLPLFLFAVGLVLGLAAWRIGLRVQQPKLREALRGASFWLIGAGVVSAVVVYFLADKLPTGLPIYGFGMMLFLAFIVCTWVAGRRAESEGVAREHIQDLAIWLFIGGLLGARITFLISERPDLAPKEKLEQIYKIWDGGIVLYGSVIGALISYFAAYLLMFRRYKLSTLKLADILAPSIAVGLSLGRFGCFLNGCCYGQVACPTCPVYAVHFPLSAPAREGMVEEGYQTAAGFTLAPDDQQPRDGARVGVVDPRSLAYANGLRSGDVIRELHPVLPDEDPNVANVEDLIRKLASRWPRGERELSLKVIHKGAENVEALPAFTPRTLGLHPTQLYEVVSMILMFLLLTAYYPLRRHAGQVIAVLMAGYGVHRYLNELLRDDPRPKGFESYTSIVLVLAGIALWAYLQTRPASVSSEIKEQTKLSEPRP